MRFFGPTIKRVAPGGERHIPRARTLLGIVARRMELGGLQQLVQRWKMSDGFTITTGIITGIPFIEISGVVATVELPTPLELGFLTRPAYASGFRIPADGGASPWYNPEGPYKYGWKPPYEVAGEPYMEDGLNVGQAATAGTQTTFLLSVNRRLQREHSAVAGNIDWRNASGSNVVSWNGPAGRTMSVTPGTTGWGQNVYHLGTDHGGPAATYIFGACLWEDSTNNTDWLFCIAFKQRDEDWDTGSGLVPAFNEVLYAKKVSADNTSATTTPEDVQSAFDAWLAAPADDRTVELTALQNELDKWIKLGEFEFQGTPEEVTGSYAYFVDPAKTTPWFSNQSGTKCVTVRRLSYAGFSAGTSAICYITFGQVPLVLEGDGQRFITLTASPSHEANSALSSYSIINAFQRDIDDNLYYAGSGEISYNVIRGADYVNDALVTWVENVNCVVSDYTELSDTMTHTINSVGITLTTDGTVEGDVFGSSTELSTLEDSVRKTIAFRYVDLRLPLVAYALQTRGGDPQFDTFVEYITDGDDIFSFGGKTTDMSPSISLWANIPQCQVLNQDYPGSLFDAIDVFNVEEYANGPIRGNTSYSAERGGWNWGNFGERLYSCVVGVDYSIPSGAVAFEETFNYAFPGDTLEEQLEITTPSGNHFYAYIPGRGFPLVGYAPSLFEDS